MKAFMEHLLDSFNITDKERYFMPPQMGAATLGGGQPAPPGTPPGTPPTPGGNGAGVTNVPAAAGPLAPSNAQSMSPEAAMARLMSQRGGANNAG